MGRSEGRMKRPPHLGLLLLILLLLAACTPTPVALEPSNGAPAAFQANSSAATAPPPAATPTLATQARQATTVPPARATITAPPLTSTPGLPPTIAPSPTVPTPPTTTPEPVCDQPGRMETGVLNSVITGEPLAYRVYLPPCYGQDNRAYPALYLLGGNIHNDDVWDRLGMDEAAEAGIAAGTLQPLILVMPDGGWIANQTSGGPFSYEGLIVNELIPHIEQRYCAIGEASGRALGGLSRGGYWSLEIAFRQPELFRSVGGHSFALLDSHAGPDMDPVSTGVANNLGDLRIYLDIGANDYLLPRAQPLHDALTAAGVPHVWQINDGTHEEAYWQSQVGAYLDWYNAGWDRLPDNPCLPANP